MTIHPGNILISSPALDDPNFEKAVIVITEHNEKGALGFVVNKLFPRKLNELAEFKDASPFNLYAGGPVDTGNLFVLHRRPGLIADGTPVFGNVYMGGNFKQAVQQINDNTIDTNDIKLFIGYCGWNGKELEAEIEEGSWLIMQEDEDLIFTDGKMSWEKLSSK